jgi:hypothetical protein
MLGSVVCLSRSAFDGHVAPRPGPVARELCRGRPAARAALRPRGPRAVVRPARDRRRTRARRRGPRLAAHAVPRACAGMAARRAVADRVALQLPGAGRVQARGGVVAARQRAIRRQRRRTRPARARTRCSRRRAASAGWRRASVPSARSGLRLGRWIAAASGGGWRFESLSPAQLKPEWRAALSAASSALLAGAERAKLAWFEGEHWWLPGAAVFDPLLGVAAEGSCAWQRPGLLVACRDCRACRSGPGWSTAAAASGWRSARAAASACASARDGSTSTRWRARSASWRWTWSRRWSPS